MERLRTEQKQEENLQYGRVLSITNVVLMIARSSSDWLQQKQEGNGANVSDISSLIVLVFGRGGYVDQAIG